MPGKNLTTAKAYYLAVNNKSLSEVEKCLHPNVHLISPFANIVGKELVLNAVKGFMTTFKTLTISTECGSGDQVMLVYDLDCPVPIGFLRAAVLMNFQDNLIVRLELFFDSRPFEKRG
jgi:hypothetical protein